MKSLFSVEAWPPHDPIFRIRSSVEQTRGEQCKGEWEEEEQWWSPREVEFSWVKELSSLTGGGRGQASLGIQEGRKSKNRDSIIASISSMSRPRVGVMLVHLESHGLEGTEEDAHWPSHFIVTWPTTCYHQTPFFTHPTCVPLVSLELLPSRTLRHSSFSPCLPSAGLGVGIQGIFLI